MINELLKKIRKGDEEAFSTLFNHFKDDVFHLSVSLTRSVEIAEDIVQEVFLKLWLQRINLPYIDNFGGYIATITKNAVLNLFRADERRERREFLFQQSESTWLDIADKVQEKEYNEQLEKVLLALPPQQAKVFRCIKLLGMGRNDTALELGLSPETVKKHLERALKNIKASLLVHFNDLLLLYLIIILLFFL